MHPVKSLCQTFELGITQGANGCCERPFYMCDCPLIMGITAVNVSILPALHKT